MNIKTLADDVIHAVRDFVSRSIGPLEARLQALEARPVPQDGKSVTVEEFRGLLNDIVEERIKALPAPKDGTSVTLDDVLPVIEAHLKAIPVPKDGASVTLDDVRPLVEAAVAAVPKPKDGNDGKSVTLEEVRTYLDAELATWALGFERRAQDVLQRAIDRMPPPKDGRDGFSLDDLQIDQRDERTVVLRFMRGDLVREREIRLGHPLDQGVFREGTAYRRGDGVTFGGSWWIAQKDAPEGKPGVSSDWRLAVKKGRDGKDWSGPK
jgi:hypothetical protein